MPESPDAHVPVELRKVAEQVQQGQHPSVPIRTLLSWFWGSKRRGTWIVNVIREALTTLNIRTDPDFNYSYLDDSVMFIPLGTSPARVVSSEATRAHMDSGKASAEDTVRTDPTYRIGRLEVAHKPPVCIEPDAPVKKAITLMLENDFSQLPVMTNLRDVKGLISWKSLGSRLSLGKKCEIVRAGMENHCEIETNASIFAAVTVIKRHECVLIRDSKNVISGIMTASDVSETFVELGEPFLLLGEIENHIRILMKDKYSVEELGAARLSGDDSRKITDVSNLTMGEVLRLLSKPEGWEKLGLQVDRVEFVKSLDEIRRIRNDVMHFDPEGIDDPDKKKLRDFVEFLRRLRELGV